MISEQKYECGSLGKFRKITVSALFTGQHLPGGHLLQHKLLSFRYSVVMLRHFLFASDKYGTEQTCGREEMCNQTLLHVLMQGYIYRGP